MEVSLTELRGVMNDSISSFNQEEKYLIENDLSERCICARLALHITRALFARNLSDYIVDVEYNRGADGTERAIKRLDNRPITVDIIVHKRGYDCDYGFDNLICIEVKKSTDRRGVLGDETRLMKMTDYAHGFQYKVGYMVLIDKYLGQLSVKQEFQNGNATI